MCFELTITALEQDLGLVIALSTVGSQVVYKGGEIKKRVINEDK